jgi:GPH family glycoside/pentoside/hexuronide:cation symporter
LVVEGPLMAVLALAALMLYSACYTIFTVPYLAMPPDIATSYDGRTRVMSFRVFFLMAGVLAGSAGAPMVVQMMGGGAEGYRVLGMLLGGIAVVVGLVAFAGSRPLPYPKALDSRGESAGKLALSPFVDMLAVLRNVPFRLLTLVKLCQLAVLAVALACTPYFFTFVLQRSPADIGLYLLVFGLSGIASLPLWRKVIARFGKKETYMVLLVAYAVGMASWFLWQPNELEVFFYLRALFIGMASTGTVLCALALLPDTMEFDRLTCGRSRDGVISGVFTLVEKIAGALGPLVIGALLGAMGLVAGSGPDIVQPDSALLAVKVGMSLIPALFCLAAIPFLMAYRLDEQGLNDARRAAVAAV